MQRTPTTVLAALLVVLVVAVTACSPSPGASPAGGASPPPATAAPGSTTGSTGGTGLPSRSTTTWGPIWDGVPASFPVPPGGRPTGDTGDGASSAQLAVPGGRDPAVAFYLGALRDAGYTASKDGPLEDGSMNVSATDGYQCQVQVTVWPVGDSVIVTILYGASCPFA